MTATTTEQRTTRRPTGWRSRSAFWFILLSALAGAVLFPLPYLMSSLASQAHSDPAALAAVYVHRPVAVQVALYLHIAFAGLALLLSPLQFVAGLRERVPQLHRIAGRVAFGSIAIAGSAALVIAPGTSAGPVGTAGFGLVALLWLAFAAAALRAIRRRDVAAHRRWATRTFALTYAAVTLRLWLGVLVTAQMELSGVAYQVAWDRAYLVVPFLSWVPNLLLAECYLATRQRTGRAS